LNCIIQDVSKYEFRRFSGGWANKFDNLAQESLHSKTYIANIFRGQQWPFLRLLFKKLPNETWVEKE
jgi:hypothetical protein